MDTDQLLLGMWEDENLPIRKKAVSMIKKIENILADGKSTDRNYEEEEGSAAAEELLNDIDDDEDSEEEDGNDDM